MLTHRLSIALLLSASLLAPSCKKKDAGGAANGSAGSAAPAPAPTPAAPPAPAPAPGDPTAVVPAAKLSAIPLPPIKGVPASAKWVPVPGASDGDLRADLVDNGHDYWAGVRFLDCNLPMVKPYADKPAKERGDIAVCFDAPADKLGGFALSKPSNGARWLKLGHLAILVSTGATGEGKLTGADLEAWLTSMDLATLSKL